MTRDEAAELTVLRHDFDDFRVEVREHYAELSQAMKPVIAFYGTISTLARAAGSGIVWGARLAGFVGALAGIAVAARALGVA